MEDFVICLDLFQRVDLLLAALAHVRAVRLDLLHERYVKRVDGIVKLIPM